jgi:hypothetical protein
MVRVVGAGRGGEVRAARVRSRVAARSHPGFHLHLVENVRQVDPAHFRLLDIHGDLLQQLMARAVPRSYVTVPLPVADHDALTAIDAEHPAGPASPPQPSP